LAYHHDFRQLWIGDTISQVGTQLSLLALPVLAVRQLGASEFQMGLLAAFETLAFLVIGLPAGAWVDRMRKRRVLIVADLVRALALGSLPVAFGLDVLTLTQMYVVALVFGVCTVFFVSYQSYLPSLVPRDRIVEGNAKLQASQSVAQVAGPAIAGQLLRIVSAPLVIGLDALTFLLSAFFVRRIEHEETPPDKAGRRSLRAEIAEGLSFVLHQPLLVRIVACTGINNLFSSISGALIVLFVLRDLGLSAAILGTVFSAGAVGGLLGALAATKVATVVGEGRAIPVSQLVSIPFVALTPLAPSLPVPPALTLAVGSFGMFAMVVVYNITQVSFRQRLCPPALLGRMNASIRFVVWGTMPIGAVLGGVIGERFGILTALWVAVAGAALSVLPVLFSPLIRMRELPRHLDAHA
jgi:MFS family permease